MANDDTSAESSTAATARGVSHFNKICNDRQDVFQVEKILKKRKHPKKGVLYFVKWYDFPPSANTWEPATSFFSPQLIEDFEKEQSKRKRQKTNHNISTVTKQRTTASKKDGSLPSPSSSTKSKKVPNKGRFVQLSSIPQKTTKIESDIDKEEKSDESDSQETIISNKSQNGEDSMQTVENMNINTVITVTDLTWDHQTVTICESKNPVGFFENGENILIEE